ncbi:MAG: c-type cytochrome [Akkermansiaceae bacterium]|nr:c-type cytochrome [Akkermansiaceae bacterium]
MSVPNSKPDLDESINVAEAHGRIIREAAATAREKRIADNGREPVSIGLIVVIGITGVIAGGILGHGGDWFNYKTLFKPGYVRAEAPGGEDSGPKPKPAIEVLSARGAKLYSAKCAGCHGPDAKGDGSNYPALAGSKRVLGNTDALAMVILNGLQGPTSSGKTYGAGLMPPQGAGMGAEDLAGLLTYIRNGFGNTSGDVVTVDMAKAALDISGKRAKAGQPSTDAEVMAEHDKALPGEPLDPQIMMDPVTLQLAPAP